MSRVSQDGVRVRVGAGASSFRREERLQKLLEESKRHVEELRRQLESPEYPEAAKAKKAAGRSRERRRSRNGWNRRWRSCPN